MFNGVLNMPTKIHANPASRFKEILHPSFSHGENIIAPLFLLSKSYAFKRNNCVYCKHH